MSIFGSKKSKRIILILAVFLAAFMLTGCGAKLTVYEVTKDGVRFHEYELTLDNPTKTLMERTAAVDGDGKKYTVESYFTRLFYDFGYLLIVATRTDSDYSMRFGKAVTDGGELAECGTAVNFTTTHTENPFVRTYTAVSESPFNGVRENYDNVQPFRSATVLERLKNGAIAHDANGETVVSLPAIDDAFPYLKGLDLDGLLLNYVRYGSDRMESSGSKIQTDDGTAYVFSRYFDDTEQYISYSYKRAVPYGWYMVAIAAGALVFGLIMLFTRAKKEKPTLLDRFPYNPEEYRDYDSHLPTKM